jgi:hypothetical protein
MDNRVEIAFDLSGNPNLNYATLDDDVRGILGSEIYVLGGALFIDITDKVRSYSITRGKSRQLDLYPAGKATVRLDNNDRTFDPLFDDSPYRGQIIPRRDIRIVSNGATQFRGLIDDWDLNYSPNGDSEAEVIVSDALTLLANQKLEGGTFEAELSGERIETVLDLPQVNWPTDKRNIEVGLQPLQGDTVDSGVNALQYLQLVTRSEPGSLFVGKDGALVYKDRRQDASSATIPLLSDDGTGIPYRDIAIVFGSELLFNRIIISRANGGTAVANDNTSQRDFGITTLAEEGLLLDSDSEATRLADFLIKKYSQPEYRFEAITLELQNLPKADQDKIIGLEIGDVVEVKFTPNNIPPAISRFAEIIKIDQRVTATSHTVVLGLASLDFSFFTLSDEVFGRLSAGNSLAY